MFLNKNRKRAKKRRREILLPQTTEKGESGQKFPSTSLYAPVKGEMCGGRINQAPRIKNC